MLATQVNAQAQAEYAIDLPLIELFQAPTLAAYAQSVAARIPGDTQDLDELRDFLTDLETV
ncbi:peptide synthase [compost metagenome]